jgi:transposase
MHCTAVNNELPVSTSAVHFFNKRAHVRHWDMRVQSTVADAQKVELITKSNRKDDRHDARTLARLARIDPELLGPVRHRSAKAQIHLTVIWARAELVSARTALVNAARG